MKKYIVKNYKGNIVESLKNFQKKYPKQTIVEAVADNDKLKIMTEYGGRNSYNSRYGGNANFHPLKMLSPRTKNVPDGWLAGPASSGNRMNVRSMVEQDAIYPGKRLKPLSMVMWNPDLHKTVSWASYCHAIKNNDEEAIAKIQALGLPLDLDLGIGFDFDDNWIN